MVPIKIGTTFPPKSGTPITGLRYIPNKKDRWFEKGCKTKKPLNKIERLWLLCRDGKIRTCDLLVPNQAR
jgi:hypothetical protein